MVETCFLGSSTVTKRSRVSVVAYRSAASASKLSSTCSLLRSAEVEVEEAEAGLEFSTSVPLVSSRSCGNKRDRAVTSLFALGCKPDPQLQAREGEPGFGQPVKKSLQISHQCV